MPTIPYLSARLSQEVYLRINTNDLKNAIQNATRVSDGNKYIIIFHPSNGSDYEIKVFAKEKDGAENLIDGYRVKEIKSIKDSADYQEGLIRRLEMMIRLMVSNNQINNLWSVTPNRALGGDTPRSYVIKGKSKAVIKTLEAADYGVPL
ncbi:hypothetical protein [Deinococcus marmoris]|uniref:hypothetical protein n=1 Tax=Deinococcus marmoris TaxID=249408 RepID=UPI0011152DBE|nr:hypothetical protein [Deinococcus marmoris]